jgi:hypothetical protein
MAEIEPEKFNDLTDEELLEFVKKEASKDDSVLAKLIIIQRIRTSLLKERSLQRIMTASAIALSVLALIIGIGGYLAFDKFLDERVQRTATACRDDVDDAVQANKGLEKQVDSLFFIESLSVDPSKDPAKAAFLQNLVDAQITEIRDNYQKVRDCSPSGIDDYNLSHGKEGFLEGPQVTQSERRNHVEVPATATTIGAK